MRHDSPRERMFALILFSVRRSGSTKQRNTEDIPAAREPVLAFAENRHAVPELGQVRVLVPAHFELGLVPGGISMRGPLDKSELGFVGRGVGVDVEV